VSIPNVIERSLRRSNLKDKHKIALPSARNDTRLFKGSLEGRKPLSHNQLSLEGEEDKGGVDKQSLGSGEVR